MLRSFLTLSVSLGLISFAVMPACYADEASSTSVETSTPAGTASTKVESRSDALGTTTKVKKSASDVYGNASEHSRTRSTGLGGVTETESKTRVGAGGAVSSHSASSTSVDAAGGVTQSKRQVERVNSPLGSSTTVKKETQVTP